MVTEFSKNPQPFIASYKARVSFTKQFKDTSYTIEDEGDYIEASHNTNASVYISTGETFNTRLSQRWVWDLNKDDLIIFAPDSTDKRLMYQEAFVDNEEYYFDFLDTDYKEEDLFQLSTVVSLPALETLELFLYLKKNCTIPFKINLRMFDIDVAVGVYREYNKHKK